ncbi:helix-turn-helix domain-containing protein [Desulfuribacillus alkaliarsenatis]|uniref:Sigma-54 factor interaction domain-containing protein n=1 Tax=Desulfuribacillus alkaliarsenatis TaxID=766136 RepID=A0A1E5G4R0_9FIRM|nr:helix-turn-helix domain-containing protein [Desulfuribacillus alkaliarsenatis]OEF97661.1 hypothetical protein BHF68_14250 [Desulfuribacillus alkaliarsenatis]
MSDYNFDDQMVPFSFFHSVIEMLPIAIDIINEEQTSVLSNSLFAEMFAWNDKYPFTEEIYQAFLFKTAINTDEYKCKTISGDERTVHLIVEPLFDQADVIGAVIIARDITNIVNYQQEYTKLENTVTELKNLLAEKQELLLKIESHSTSSQELSSGHTIDDKNLKEEIDYTSRDNNTWLAIRELRNSIKANHPVYLYGDIGLEKRAMVKQILQAMRIRTISWIDLKANKQLSQLRSDMEVSKSFVVVDVKHKQLLQPTIDMLAGLSHNANKNWLIIGDAPIKTLNNNIDIIRIPSLKERKSDILLLVDKLLPEGIELDDEVKRKFIQYQWPKNIRELRSVLIYADSMRAPHEPSITIDHLDGMKLTLSKAMKLESNIEDSSTKTKFETKSTEATSNVETSSTGTIIKKATSDMNALDLLLQSMDKSNQSMPDIFEKIERIYIEKVFQKSDYNITHTANKLGIKRQALQYKLKKYNLAPDEAPEKLN